MCRNPVGLGAKRTRGFTGGGCPKIRSQATFRCFDVAVSTTTSDRRDGEAQAGFGVFLTACALQGAGPRKTTAGQNQLDGQHAAGGATAFPEDNSKLTILSNQAVIALTMNPITSLTPHQLRKAADVKEKIDALQNQLSQLLDIETLTPAAGAEKPKRSRFNSAALANIRAAQKARWAAKRGEAPRVPAAEKASEKPKKRKMTEAWRRALARAHAARRAKARAARMAKL
jgi:hypothetical protein